MRNALFALALVPFAGLGGGCTTPVTAERTADVDARPKEPERVVPFIEKDAAAREAIARLRGYFPNHELTTMEGERVRFFEDLVRDKEVLINFMYVECDGL